MEGESVTLREHLEELRRQDAEIRALDRDLAKARADAQDKATAAALAALAEATHRADAAYEKRLDLLNEFKAAMGEQSAKYMTRREVGAWGVALLAIATAAFQALHH